MNEDKPEDNQYMNIEELNKALENDKSKNELRNRIMKRWLERDQEPFEKAKQIAEEYHRHVADVKKMLDIQCSNGNWNYDPYMHGMANGLIVAYSVLTGTEPIFKEAPAVWLKDLEPIDIMPNPFERTEKENENDKSE